MEEVDEKINGSTVNYIHGGEGEPLVLFPGWPSNFSGDSYFLKSLSKYFEVFALNLPGFGCSGKLSDKPDLRKLIKYIDSFIEQKKLKKFKLLGMSYGGMLALKYTADYPDKVNKLVLIAPFISFSSFAARIRLFYKFLFFLKKIAPVGKILNSIISNEKFFARFYFLITGYDYNSDQGRKDYTSNRDNIRQMNFTDCFDMFDFLESVDLKEDAKKIVAPTFVISGKKDTFVGASPKVLIKLIKTSQLLEQNAQHWGLINKDSAPKIIKFLTS